MLYKNIKYKEKFNEYKDYCSDEPIEFIGCEFSDKAIFSYFKSSSRIKFLECTFTEDIIFGNKKNISFCSYVEQDIVFDRCSFGRRLLLDGMTTKGNIIIANCHFKGVEGENPILSVSSASVGNSLVIQDTFIKGGVSLSGTSIKSNGCIMKNVTIENDKSELNLSSCYFEKELSIWNCDFNLFAINLNNTNVGNGNGKVNFGCILREEFTVRNQDEKKLNKYETESSLMMTDGHQWLTTTRTQRDETPQTWCKPNILRSEYLFLSATNFCGTFDICNTVLDIKNIFLQEGTVSSFQSKNSCWKTNILSFEGFTTHNSLTFDNTIFICNNENSLNLCLSGMQIGNNMELNCMSFYDSNNKNFIDLSNTHIKGFLTLDKLRGKEVTLSLENSEAFSVSLNTDNNECSLLLNVEEFRFVSLKINKKIPDHLVLKQMIPSRDAKLLGIKNTNENCQLSSGSIGFLRNCQEQMVSYEDKYDDANEIWRLRNRLRINQISNYKKNKKWILCNLWNYITDFGLSSTRIGYVVLIVFFIYCGLNVLIVQNFTASDPSNNPMEVIGQSLIQYIPTVDFGDELKIINFEEGLPNSYKYLVIAARITGFILISILVASFAGLWKGRNK